MHLKYGLVIRRAYTFRAYTFLRHAGEICKSGPVDQSFVYNEQSGRHFGWRSSHLLSIEVRVYAAPRASWLEDWLFENAGLEFHEERSKSISGTC
jgi:hypothetical protein